MYVRVIINIYQEKQDIYKIFNTYSLKARFLFSVILNLNIETLTKLLFNVNFIWKFVYSHA